MTTTLTPVRQRRRSIRILTAAAVTALCLGGLSGCGGSGKQEEAEKQATQVGDAIKAESEKSGSDITTAISKEPWKKSSGLFVSGTFDFLVVNVDEEACAKLAFESDESGADYTIKDTYDC